MKVKDIISDSDPTDTINEPGFREGQDPLGGSRKAVNKE